MIKTYTKDNKEIPYLIIEKNNKHTYFKVKPNYIQINKAKTMSLKQVLNFLDKNFEKFYNNFISAKNLVPKEDVITLEDKDYKIIVNKSRVFSYFLKADNIIVNTNKTDLLEIKKIVYKAHLEKMLKSIEKEVLERLKLFNIKERQIKLKHYKSRYGSYHKKSDHISLNIVLAKTNIIYTYYVLMHEYAHTVYFNHSKNFYNTLEKLMPNYKKYDKKIKTLSIYL